MKRQFLILIAIAAFVIVSTPNAFVQTGKTVKADVKFDFQIGEGIYPAGEYVIERVSPQSDNILQIRSSGDANKKQIIVAGVANAGKRQTPKLVFQKYGENYFLTRIFLDTEQWGYSIQRLRRQRENEKNLAVASLETIEIRLAK